MKACKVTFSIELLLNQIGLENAGELSAYLAEANYRRKTVTLYLSGEHPDLPELNPGNDVVPEARISCKRIESKLEVVPPGSTK